MYNILLVEDCLEIYQILLQSAGDISKIHWAQNLQEAREKLKGARFDLFIIDLGLPDGNGIDLCSQLQSTHPQSPLFILTAETDLSKKVMGFSAGADHYITKPVDVLELRVRIESCLNKHKNRQTLADSFKWRELSINKFSQVVTLIEGVESTHLDLTALEFKILLYLASRVGEVIPRGEILQFVWGRNIHVNNRSVDTHVSKLRKKLGPAGTLIESIHGEGYKFSPTPC